MINHLGCFKGGQGMGRICHVESEKNEAQKL